MSQLEVFVLEPSAVDGLATGAIVVGEVTTLTHEVRNHPVETATLIAETLFSGTKRAEILRRLGNDILPQLPQESERLFSTSLSQQRSNYSVRQPSVNLK